jgi:hypothetical protein
MARCNTEEKGIRLELEPNEADLLRFMGRELCRLLENSKEGGQKLTAFSPIRQRENDEQAVVGDLEAPMEAELLFHRLKRIETVQTELLDGSEAGQRLNVLLDDVRADVWLAFLADLRLLLAEVIGIAAGKPDPFMEEEQDEWTLEMKMYQFLSVLQEWILEALE